MHGQRRSDYKEKQRDPKVAAKLQLKATQWRQLTAQLPEAPPDVAWNLTETLLRVNPDPLYIWNQRRDLFFMKSGHVAGGSDDDNDALLEQELNLTAAALQGNPKAYGAWFHRKWVLVQAANMDANDRTTTCIADLLQQELGLTEMFLQRDERNFHCWNYRRFVVSLQMQSSADGSWWLLSEKDDPETEQIVMGAQIVMYKKKDTAQQQQREEEVALLASSSSPEEATAAHNILQAEWEFTRAKIGQNFSNFSAFHYRSKLLQLLWPRVDLGAELQLVEDAVYTEPDDQTAWWYQAFLLDIMRKDDSLKDRIHQHLEALQELAEEVTECKWVRLGMLACLEGLSDTKDRQCELWQALMEMDPDRKARYQHMMAKLETV